jgi:alpha-galactosidase
MKKLLTFLAFASASAISSYAAIYTLPDVVRSANGGTVDEHFDFVTNDGWSGTPPNAISGEDSVYLKFTVSWSASADIGFFEVQPNAFDDGSAGRWAARTAGSGFDFLTLNANSDPDNTGPATAQPSVDAYDTSANTSATFVLKVDQITANTSPGGDWWYGDVGFQDDAAGFLYINPNLGAPESGQSTKWAAWRSGNASYQGISFQTTTSASTALTFTNITLYTGDDTPFSAAGPVDAGTSTASASPTAVPADGTSTSAITVTLKDAGGSLVSDKEVSLSGDGSAIIENSSNISDANGEVIFTVKSSTVGTETFTATNVTDSNMIITQTASVDFQEVVPVGPVDAANSTVVTSAASIPANGIATATITVTLRDSNGALIVGEDVNLAGSPPDAVISPAGAQTTDANGEATFTVSSTVIGTTVTFSATSGTDNITVTDTADVEFVDPATATAYNVNFLDEGQADATGQLGVVGDPGEFWNQGTTTVSNLVDTTGVFPSSISVSGLGNDGRFINNATLSVFSGIRNFTGKGLDTTISVSGLEPDTAYDLYIYALSHNTSSWGEVSNTERGAGDFVTSNTVLGNGQSQWLDNAVTGTDDTAFVPSGNYVVFQSIVSDGSGNISVLVDAYDGIDGNSSTQDGDTRLHVNGLQIRPTSGMSVDYTAWRDNVSPSLGLPGEDDDGDTLSNDYERIFGLDPTDPASASPLRSTFDPETGTFSYSRRTPSLVNLNYTLWYSTDLDEWFQDNGAFQAPQSAANDVEIMDVVIDSALLSEPRLFIQMRASALTGIDLEPELLSVRGSGSTMTLLFSKPMHPSTAADPANYTVELDGGGALGITGSTASSDGGSVTLTLDSTLAFDSDYTVAIDGVTSGTGQSIESGLSRAFKTWDDTPTGIKVFIVTGQSNMLGRGERERGNGDVDGAIGSLRYEVVNDNASYGQLVVDSGSPATDEWVVRSDVHLYWNRADIGAGTNVSEGGLTPAFGSGPTTFGPEYGFGWAMGEHFSEPVLIIKTAWGGKDLFNNFRPPSAVAERGGSVGGYYIEVIEQVREVLNNFDSLFPEWSGQGYQIAGFGWHQGWNDSLNTFTSNEYEANMANFITDIRAEFGKPSLPVAIGTTGMVGAATSGDRLTVVNAQINVANPTLHPELGGNVFTVDTRPFARTTEESPTNDTTHWKNNGESMWLIGKGMGDGIVNLLTAP